MNRGHILYLLTSFLFSSQFIFASDPLPEIPIDKTKIQINQNAALLNRTVSSPKEVDVQMLIPMVNNVCTRYETKFVYGQNPYCGYETIPVWRCYQVCDRWQYDPRTGRSFCTHWSSQCNYAYEQRMRFCEYPVQYCAKYETVTTNEARTVSISFKKAETLKTNDIEQFQLVATQKEIDSSTVHFELTPIKTVVPYVITQPVFSSKLVVKKK